MTEPQGFVVNREEVAAKVIDGELIVIRLSDGTYYSMEDVGTRVWELLADGHDLPAVVSAVAVSYRADVERVESDLRGLVQQLLDEGLVLPAAPSDREPLPRPPSAESAPYRSPELHIYRDMGNLLALDPPTPGIDDLLFRDGSTAG